MVTQLPEQGGQSPDYRREAVTVRTSLRRGRSGSEMAGAPFARAGGQWRGRGAPIPSAIDPGRAEQTRHVASEGVRP